MKRKFISTLFALVLVLTLGLVTAAPVAVSANGTTHTLAGGTITVTSITPCETLDQAAFDAEPHTTVVDDVAFDAQSSSQVVIEGAVSNLVLGAGWVDTAYIEIGLRPEATMDARNAGVYLIALNGASGTEIHLQDYTGGGRTGGVIEIAQNSDFRYKITLTPLDSIGGTATLQVWVGEDSKGTVTLPYGYASTWEEGVAGALDEDFSNAHLFYSIIADRRGIAGQTYSATVGDITIDDTLYVGTGQQFTTIQAAIDFANPGDTINVAAGVYSEWQDNGYDQSAGNIIDKPLHLQGSGDDCIIRGKTGTAFHMPYSPILWVKADNVEIDHFKFDGATYTEEEPKGLRSYGIFSAWKVDSTDYAATNLNVHHNTFVFIGTAVKQDRAGGGDITVAYNTMVRETRSVWYKPAGATPGSYVDMTLGGGGANLWSVVGGTVHDNTGIETPGIGISLYGCQDLTIGPNNVVSAPNTTDPSDAGIYINGGSNITVTGNTVSNFKNGEDPSYTCGKMGAGISIYSGGCDGFTIENNNLTNNSVGVYVATVESMDTPTNVEVHNNNIEGNDDYGVCNFRFPPQLKDPETGESLNKWDYDSFSPANNDIDATNNWWGSANGPEHTGNTFNVGYQGDKVSDYVDYVPWLNAAYPAGTSFAPVTNEDTGDEFSSIQAAIDDGNTDAGDTISVAAGTYSEHVVITTSNLNLIGEDRETTIIDARQDSSWTYPKPGILINGVSGVTVSGFTIQDAELDENGNPWTKDFYGPGPQAMTAILIYATSSDHVIENNILINNHWGVFVCAEGQATTECRNNRIANNIIRDGAQDGVYLYTDGVVPVENTQIVNNEISNAYGESASGVEFWAWPATEPKNLAITGTIIQGNNITDCTYGLRFRDDVTDITGTLANYNNFIDNMTYGVYNGVASTINATYNWWGHPSGPGCELSNGKWVGKGDKVSDNVDYKPWLHKSKEDVVPDKKPAYAQSVVLDNTGDYGWNTFSAPIFLDAEADTWKELCDLADNLTYSVAYRFDSDNQTFVPLTTTDDYAISPGEGFFIKMKEAGCLTILYSTEENLIPPSRPLTAGWNLIGLANLEDMNVDDAFPSIATAPGLAGYSQVVSPIGNVSLGAVLADGTIYVGESYWVYMLGARTLAGFTMTPVKWVP